MSRCFPFPPPGYDKKAKSDNVDLLKKEKHREKKHKKEKRDKEKRESKEKREKDKSEGKHREKKDKKEKHRDKKKDKEKNRDRDKSKSSTSDEKGLTWQSEGNNGEALSQKQKDREKDKNSSSDKKQFSGHFVADNGQKLIQNSRLVEETKDSIFVQELDRRITDGERATGNKLVEKLMVTDRKKDEALVRLVTKDISYWAEGEGKNNDKRGEDKKIDMQRRDGAKCSGNPILPNVPGFVRANVEGIPRPLEKSIENKMEDKEKTKRKEGNDKRGDKRKDKDREKKSHGKDKDRDKGKNKEEKAKVNCEQKTSEQDKFREGNKNDIIITHNNNMSHLPKDSNTAAATEGNLRKRKDLEANGFLHATGLGPNKLPRSTSSHSPHALVENGRVLEPCQTPMKPTGDSQGVPSNLLVDKKLMVNGILEALPNSISSLKPSSATAKHKTAEPSLKAPHPDTKYLGQILSVPKMEEWSDFIDQEWLLCSEKTQLKKPKVGDPMVDETPQVWAEAMQIDSADVCALPYVIPY